VQACRLVGYPKASYYRHSRPRGNRPTPIPQSDRAQPNALTETERSRVLEILNTTKYANSSVGQTYYRAWDDGHYVASKSSFYRVARAAGQVGDRRRQRTGAPPRKIPELVTTGPNQVWSWDITKLRGPVRGEWFHFYVIVDIFSRRIVGWRVEAHEDADMAEEMVQAAITNNNGQAPHTVHSDNGSAMVSQPVAELLKKLGINRSLSRPKVSNDNPYSEAWFKTYKYDLDFPGSFDSIAHAREFCHGFVHEYNTNHHHSGIGWHTPDNVHYGRTTAITTARRRHLDNAYRAHPKRFTKRPKPPTMPTHASINDPRQKPLPT